MGNGIDFETHLETMIMASRENNKVQQNPAQNNQSFQTDAHKLAAQHMANQDHVITDEDFANVRVGMTPPADAPTQQAVAEAEDRIADHKSDKEDDAVPGAQKTTPWDVINP